MSAHHHNVRLTAVAPELLDALTAAIPSLEETRDARKRDWEAEYSDAGNPTRVFLLKQIEEAESNLSAALAAIAKATGAA